MEDMWLTWIFAIALILAGAFFAVMLLLWLTSKPVKAEFLRFDDTGAFHTAIYRIEESEIRNILPTARKMEYLYSAGNERTVWKSRIFDFVIDWNSLVTIIVGAALLIPTVVMMLIAVL